MSIQISSVRPTSLCTRFNASLVLNVTHRVFTRPSKRPANFQQTSNTTFARRLLDVCWIV